MRNILLTISYDGSEFFGWQRQKKFRSVQGELEKALSILCGQQMEVFGSSRTDAGVHALGQGANFIGEFKVPFDKIQIALNKLLPRDIRVTHVQNVEESFHARYSSVGKKYEYRILNAPAENPFLRKYVHYIEKELDIDAMQQGAEYLKGAHDFRAFMGSVSKPVENTVRNIYKVNVFGKPHEFSYFEPQNQCNLLNGNREDYENGNIDKLANEARKKSLNNIYYPYGCFESRIITIEIAGTAFLYNMVRLIAETLIDVGLHKIEAEEVKKILDSKERIPGSHIAPAQGLYLMEVYFDENKRKIFER